MTRSKSWWSIAAINILLPLGILMFAKGFFPYKPFLPGLAQFDAEDIQTEKPFDKVVFMVVDALRSDFVFGERSGFKFTQSLISSERAIPFTAHATSPTITMPRVKAITTGSIPGFLDVILNFAESDTTSSLAQQDNWLAQIKANGGKLVMYGDDTWLKLFPGMFHRSDGTTSFFVSDFTEVDNNVTRHIDDELKRDDWDAMVLHYLGMDHIGHKSGPLSPNMYPKQVEMDGIVERIYTAIETSPHLSSTLFVLAGDHGMNDAGNHGGSGEGETSPALVFMSPKLSAISSTYETPLAAPATPNSGEFGFYKTIEQSDLAPTLVSLLGLPVPRNNLGVLIPDFLKLWNPSEQAAVVMRNAHQLKSIISASHPEFDILSSQSSTTNEVCTSFSGIEHLACLWRNTSHLVSTGDVSSLLDLCTEYQSLLSSTASNYDIPLMLLGIFVTTISLCWALWHLLPQLSGLSASFTPLLFTAYIPTMFASSFIEEEHHFWYLLSSLWFLLLLLRNFRRGTRQATSILLLLSLLRLTRRWNQTGIKHAGAPDIARHWLPAHPTILWILVLVTYTDTFSLLWNHTYRPLGRQLSGILSFATTAAAFIFKLSFTLQDSPELVPSWLLPLTPQTSLITLARVVFLFVLLGFFYSSIFSRSLKSIQALTTIFLLTQSRTANLPLFHIFRLMAWNLPGDLTGMEQEVTGLLMQQMGFFAMGGANAISSVDLSQAYNGVDGFNVVVVAGLTLVGNWAAGMWWRTVLPGGVPKVLKAPKAQKAQEVAKAHGAQEAAKEQEAQEVAKTQEGIPQEQLKKEQSPEILTTTFFTLQAVSVMVACTLLRSHLFIWTVFSPKYLYVMAWTGWNLIGNLGWGWCVRRMVR
ncbi:alkaline-phosphatase-like protein [Pyronema omphalodes]|nr:alkaline-phosphatase-like protein [Pyronema omphalodes]